MLDKLQMVDVQSTNIARTGWMNDALFVEFKSGATYRYEGVPEVKFKELVAAESAGKFFASEIKAIYPFQKLEELTLIT